MSAVGTQRLHPVCEASFRSFYAFGSASTKNVDGRVPCPICRKVVKLRKVGIDRHANTIPHHHLPPLAAAAIEQIELDRLHKAAPAMLAALQAMFHPDGRERHLRDEDYERARAAVSAATGA